VAIRAKLAKSVKKETNATITRGGERAGSAKRKVVGLAFEEGKKGGGGGKEPGSELGKGRVDESVFGLTRSGMPWSFEAGVAGNARERSENPPALPVPIASFTI
jgi:hypothetical protein